METITVGTISLEDKTIEEKRLVVVAHYRHAVAIETQEDIINGYVVAVGQFPEPKILIRYAIQDEELGCTQVIARHILIENLKAITNLS